MVEGFLKQITTAYSNLLPNANNWIVIQVLLFIFTVGRELSFRFTQTRDVPQVFFAYNVPNNNDTVLNVILHQDIFSPGVVGQETATDSKEEAKEAYNGKYNIIMDIGASGVLQQPSIR